MTKLFISYRRDDNAYAAGWLHHNLAEKFGRENVFIDVQGGFAGIDFRKVIDRKIAECNGLIVVIGEKWLDLRNADGSRRIDDPDDMVHIEIKRALDRGIPITPVYLDGGGIPKPKDLPKALEELAFRHGLQASAEKFQADVDAIAEAVERGLSYVADASPVRPDILPLPDVQDQIPEKPSDPTPSFIDNYENDIFVSYARADDEPLFSDDVGWVTRFTDVLEKQLEMRTGSRVRIWMDHRLDSATPFSEEIQHAIGRSRTALVIASPRYLASAWCRNELNLLVDRGFAEDGRLFLVERLPLDRDLLPALIDRLLGWRFWEEDFGTPIEVDHRHPLFERRMAEIATDLASAISTSA